MKAEEFIKYNMQSIMTSPYKSEEVVSIEVVKKAIEMTKKETEEKAVEAFKYAYKDIWGACFEYDLNKFKEKLEEK